MDGGRASGRVEHYALEVACPECRAPEGEKCDALNASRNPRKIAKPHRRRIEKASRETRDRIIAKAAEAIEALLPWKCPECDAPHDKCGKGECRGTRSPGGDCDGLCCDCEVGSEDPEHGQVDSKPCLRAECYHCGWEGRIPEAKAGKVAVFALEELDVIGGELTRIAVDIKRHGAYADLLHGCMVRAVATIRARDACKSSKEYKGVLPPRCNDGVGCIACWRKRAEHLERTLRLAIEGDGDVVVD